MTLVWLPPHRVGPARRWLFRWVSRDHMRVWQKILPKVRSKRQEGDGKTEGDFSLGPSYRMGRIYKWKMECVCMCVYPSSLQRWLKTLLRGVTDRYGITIHILKAYDNSYSNIAKGTTDPRVEFSYHSNFFKSYHKFLHKSWSNIFRISTKHQL